MRQACNAPCCRSSSSSSSGDETEQTDCCPEAIGRRLFATYENPGGTVCDCVVGTSVGLRYYDDAAMPTTGPPDWILPASRPAWQSDWEPFGDCGGSVRITLFCGAEPIQGEARYGWNLLEETTTCEDEYGPPHVNRAFYPADTGCSPLNLLFVGPNYIGCCGKPVATARIRVTL